MTRNERDLSERRLVNITPCAKVWLEHEGTPLVGPGRAELLEAILECGSLVHAAKKRKISFRAAWERVRKIERRLQVKIVTSKKGGEGGGGSTQLTEVGKRILRRYKRLTGYMDEALSDPELLEALEL